MVLLGLLAAAVIICMIAHLHTKAYQDAITLKFVKGLLCPPHRWTYGIDNKLVCSACNFKAGLVAPKED